jgi:N-acetylglucosaminyl-diphospho-decaprenol L-rhamnosyltransferase
MRGTRTLKIVNPRVWLGLLAVTLLLPFDVLVLVALWLSEFLYWPLSRLRRNVHEATKPNNSRASLIVLNWDGQHLLQEFLPSVVKAAHHHGGDHEIIVVDNGSCDGSVAFLHTHVPSIKVVALPKNMRFTGGNNAGVRAARNDIVVLLNNDMQVDPDFLQPLLDGFQERDVFAVSCQVFFQDKARRREETGKTRVRWKMGFLEASHDQITAADQRQRYVPVFWGGGGSCAFDRRKFLALGGLDTLYDPFYLEDTDLSYQAWKRGWKSLLAVDSVVVHKHRGTNKQKFGDNFVDNTIRKNQYLFIWKNVTNWQWLFAHICFLPLTQLRFLTQTNLKFEVKAFFKALVQLPEAISKRNRSRDPHVMEDPEIFAASSRSNLREGRNAVCFSEGEFAEQLDEGWYEVESGGGIWFRWMRRRGAVVLFPQGGERYLELKGAIPELRKLRRLFVKLKIRQDGLLIFQKFWTRSGEVSLKVPVEVRPHQPHWFEFRLNASFTPARTGCGNDFRELGMIVSEVRLTS